MARKVDGAIASTTSQPVSFRDERFIDTRPDRISLIKTGEYARTPLYEPSIRSMRLTLSHVRKQLELDLKYNRKFRLAWRAAAKLYQLRSSYLQEKFKGPEEYCISLICYTLDEPYRIYDDFNLRCQELATETWMDFPYKSLLYLLIQSETRMRIAPEWGRGGGGGITGSVKHPITITTDLDYSIEEEEEGEGDDSSGTVRSPKLHTSYPTMRQPVHRVYRGLEFPLDEKQFQPRTLVAFSHLMPTTLDGASVVKALQAKSRQGRRTTLLEIDQVSWSSRYVASLSVFPVEKEVIIWPWIKFYVEERRMIADGVERVLLKPTSWSFVGNKEAIKKELL